MSAIGKTLRVCPEGHRYYKSSDCPACPVCEAANRPENGFLSGMSAPARRALQHAGIGNEKELSQWTEKELLKLHGLGPSSLPNLREALKARGLSFKSE